MDPVLKKAFAVLLLLPIFLSPRAQDSTRNIDPLMVSGFIETYYSYDFNKPADHRKPAFLYNHNRHNETTINLAILSLNYTTDVYRARVGLMAGTYPQYNLAAEPELFRHVYEGSAGIKLSKKKELWIDAGIFPSHIGFESAISKDCWTLTRSLLAENSPYYEAGAKLTYTTKNKRWLMAALLLNGWQRIARQQGNNTPAFGTQLTFTPSDAVAVNSSTFIGSDKPDSVARWRYFHNLYAIWQFSKQWGVTVGFDVGAEQKMKGSKSYHLWYSPVAIIRYQKDGWAIAGRAEYYSDKRSVIVPPINGNAFQTMGFSLTLDRIITGNVRWRTEGRWLQNAKPYFEKSGTLVQNNLSATTSVWIFFK